MTRKKLRPDVEAAVLARARRRCAICYGLNRDTGLKRGQIAHLDRDSSNDDPENLIFICLEHHDLYDTRPSQAKGLTSEEVRRFRSELDAAITDFLTRAVSLGEVTALADQIAGRYLRTSGPQESAELQVNRVSANRIKVTGLALIGLQREYGPNIGELDFEVELEGNVAIYAENSGTSQYVADFHFTGDTLVVRERVARGMFGMGASFDGVYKRVA